jgi:hypothetical protein
MFCLFVFYTTWSCLFSLTLIVLKVLDCKSPFDDPEEDALARCKTWHHNWNVLILMVVSLIFFSFTSCMLCEQLEAIRTNSSKIARMKMKVGQAGTELSRVTEEFNEMFGGNSNNVAWHWFLPLPVEFPRSMEKIVLGFEWDETFNPTPYEEENEGDEEQGRIELTTPPQKQPANSGDGEEGNFRGTPVVKDKPQRLTKRANSTERASALRGTLT